MVVVVDANSLTRKHYHTKKQQTVSNTIATIRRATRFLGGHHSLRVVVCFDGLNANVWRQQIWPQYKQDRGERPEDLQQYLRDIYRAVKRIWAVEVYSGYEADDVLAAIVHTAGASRSRRVTLFTDDKDARMLLREGEVQQLIFRGGDFSILTESRLLTETGLRASQQLEYQILLGDATDNLPGIDGCGDKTAKKWLIEYGSLENIIANIGSLTGSKRAKQGLITAVGDGRLSKLRQVLSPRLDCPVQWRWMRSQVASLSSEMMSLAAELFGEPSQPEEDDPLAGLWG